MKRPPKKPTTYEVTLRRDVQQVVRVRVAATSRQAAIDTAESVIAESDGATWDVEKHLGTHRPEVRQEKRR